MSNSTDFVVKRLQEVLAKEAATHFPNTVLKEDLAAYIKNLTQVVDWEEDFLSDVYDLYLRKVSQAGQQLCDKISDNENN